MKEKTCCFTGHRFIKKEDIPAIAEKTYNRICELSDNGYEVFICGGALGFDTVAAKAVCRAKKQNTAIKLYLALPCRGQEKNWRESQKKEYAEILLKADKIIYVSEEYFDGCMQKRNRYMVDNSSVCIAYFDGRRGGTASTIAYAKQTGCQLLGIF